ncbi:hypothetical protein JW868_00970, partial [Candidatus Woesearchaeota archaeon]|nr:hypothetical protein [Candidatus Woesearchaeota archaeon]
MELLEEITEAEEMQYRKIQLAREARRWAETELGVFPNLSFERVATYPAVYAVFAALPDGLESAYKHGLDFVDFNTYSDARRFRSEWDAEGYHTNVVGFEAINTFSMPITPALLRQSFLRILEVVLHEQFHIHVDNKGWRFPLHVE